MVYKLGKIIAFILFSLANLISLGNLSPLITISIIIIKEGKILAVNHNDGRGFTLPGGLIKRGETIKTAAEREVKEETGYNIRLKGFIGIYERPKGNFFHIPTMVLAYKGEIVDGKLKSSLEGKASWVKKDEIKQERDLLPL